MSDNKEQELANAMARYEQAVQNGVTTREDEREERQRKRAMRSPTFKALAGQMVHPVDEWGEDLLDEVIQDTVTIERDRWAERGIWIFVALALAGAGALAGWHLKPEPEPEPILWSCTRTYDNVEVDTIECQGVDF